MVAQNFNYDIKFFLNEGFSFLCFVFLGRKFLDRLKFATVVDQSNLTVVCCCYIE